MLNKLLKKNQKLLYISSAFIFSTLIMIMCYFVYEKSFVEKSNNNNVINFLYKSGNKNKTGYIEISNIGYNLFDDYYFVPVEERIVVVKLSKNYIYQMRKNDYTKSTFKINGYLKENSGSLKKKIVDVYSNLYETDILNEDNYHLNLGYYYLDASFNDSLLATLVVVSIILIGIGIAISVIFINGSNANFKTVKKLSLKEFGTISTELYDAKRYKDVYLTDNYIVDVSFKLDIIKYSEIIIMYQRYTKIYKFFPIEAIIVYTEDKKRYILPVIKNVNLFDKILDKNKKILVGYNEENKKKIKDKYGINIK